MKYERIRNLREDKRLDPNRHCKTSEYFSKSILKIWKWRTCYSDWNLVPTCRFPPHKL